MGITKSDVPYLMTAGLQEVFMQGYTQYVAGIWQECCTPIDSNKNEETYDWLGSTPTMREWLNERAPKGMLEHNFKLKNKHFEASIEVDRNTLDDDLYGQIKQRVMQLGQEAARYKDVYFTTLLEAGTSNLCYDGQPFFSTTHSEGNSGTQSNAPAASSTYNITQANLPSVIAKVITAMRLFKDDQGKIAGAGTTHIMVHPANEFDARYVLDPSVIAQATGSTVATVLFKGRLKIIVNPYMTLADAANIQYGPYFFFDLGQPTKPFIFQKRKDAEFVSLDKPDSQENFMRRRLIYGVDERYNMGYGNWRYAYRCQGDA
jgi:phage major head subunit gpT-like protein